MVLTDAAMTAAMLARAVTQGLVDRPPHFALSRVYSVISKGVVTTLLDPAATVITVNYTGKPCITPPCIGGPTVGWTGLSDARYYPLVQTQALHFGPFSVPFFFGIGGIISYLAPTVTMTDPLAPTGTGGTGVLAAGGVVFDASECFNNMKSEAQSEGIMVVDLNTHLGGNPLGTIPDPTTGAILMLGDLFKQAEILLLAVAAQLTIELLFASKVGIITIGPINPLDVPIGSVPTITTILS